MNMKFQYLGVEFDPDKNWAGITLRPVVYSSSEMTGTGLDWLGKDSWELVSATPLFNRPELYLLFKRGIPNAR